MIQKESLNKETTEFLQLESRPLPQAWQQPPARFSEFSGQTRVLENGGRPHKHESPPFPLKLTVSGGLGKSSQERCPLFDVQKGASTWGVR